MVRVSVSDIEIFDVLFKINRNNMISSWNVGNIFMLLCGKNGDRKKKKVKVVTSLDFVVFCANLSHSKFRFKQR